MDRRSYLGALVAAGIAGAAGCLDSVPGVGGDSETALSPPDEPRGDPIHPIHGEEFPPFSITDPLAGEEVSLDDFTGERAFLMTFIFTSCQDECGTLVRTLQLVQADAAERGYGDDVAFLAMTFDPETDDAETLREYGERHDVDLDAGNWHFLRPETQEEAMTLVNEEPPEGFGSPVQVVPPEDGEHDHENGHDEHDHEGSEHDHEEGDQEGDQGGEEGDTEGDDHEDDVTGETTTHFYMIFLVNERGIVERSYPRAASRTPQEIIDDTRTVVE